MAHHSGEGKLMVATMGWPLLWAVLLATDTHVEADAWVRKLKDELRLEKGMWVSINQLASGLADKVGEQDNKLETLTFCFAKVGRRTKV